MRPLVRRWMFVVAVLGLMVGGPLLADKKVAAPAAPNAADFFKALAIAQTNVSAAAGATLKNGKPLPPEVVSNLDQVANDIDLSRTAVGSVYSIGLKDSSKLPKSPAEQDLDGQMSKATDQLVLAERTISGFEVSGHAKEDLTNATKALEHASTKLADVQAALAQANLNPGPSGTQPQGMALAVGTGATPSSTGTKDKTDVLLAKTPVAWQTVASLFALVLAASAIVLVLLSWRRVAKLRADKEQLEGQLKILTSKQSKLGEDVKSLGHQKDDLNKKLNDAIKATDQVPEEDWTQKERRTYERRKAIGIAGGSGAGGSGFADLAREGYLGVAKRAKLDEAREEDGLSGVPVKAVPKPRVPLADYNEARAKKPADRATEFGQQYAKQIAMTCSNPQVRNNGPFTDLRFREDHLGKFLAVEHGKEVLLFPELNYDYSTGRKLLEGVFQYPEVESTAYRLTQAAIVEKRGDEWALTRQGVLQNG